MTVDRLAKLGILIALLTLAVVIAAMFQWMNLFLSFFFGTRPFLDWLLHILGVVVLFAVTVGMVFIMAKVALTPERRSTGWVRAITNPNGKWLFFLAIMGWVVVMAFLASLGLNYLQGGGIALLMLFLGFFLFMGFIWAVIGE